MEFLLGLMDQNSNKLYNQLLKKEICCYCFGKVIPIQKHEILHVNIQSFSQIKQTALHADLGFIII